MALFDLDKPRTRREALRSLAFGGGVLGAALLGFFPIIKKWVTRLRPPGALAEEDFLASCIKCGQCVQTCPVKAIKLGDLDEGFAIGTPYIEPREQACDFACEAPQCILACPTGALSPVVQSKEEVEMGIAQLTRPNSCLARQGKGFKGLARGENYKGIHRYVEIDRWNPLPIAKQIYDLDLCDLCVRECPIEGAISMGKVIIDGKEITTPIIHDKCVGCGTCEMMCPVDNSAIIIHPRKRLEDM